MWTDQEAEETSNPGNFIEFVCFRAETDKLLCDHLQSAPRNALYTSKNELIHVVGKSIQSDTLAEVREAKFYTVIAGFSGSTLCSEV